MAEATIIIYLFLLFLKKRQLIEKSNMNLLLHILELSTFFIAWNLVGNFQILQRDVISFQNTNSLFNDSWLGNRLAS